MQALKTNGQSVVEFGKAERIRQEQLIALPCDIWIPAARPDVIHEGNVAQVSARLVVQGANIPVTIGAEKIMHDKGILNVPDFIANAGGVICAAMEYRGSSEASVLDSITDRVRRNTEAVLMRTQQAGTTLRQAANDLAFERVHKAMSFRRWSSYSSSPTFR